MSSIVLLAVFACCAALLVAGIAEGTAALATGLVGVENHWCTRTFYAGQIAASGVASATWTADGAYTFHALNASEIGTAAGADFKEFEVAITVNGVPWQNRAVSARALTAGGQGREFAQLLEGRSFCVLRGDTIEVEFTNVDAGAAIDPRMHFIGHRGLPTDYRTACVYTGQGSNHQPYFIVLRSAADSALTTGNNASGSYEFSDCYSAGVLAAAERTQAAAQGPLDFDVVYELSQGARQTGGNATGAAYDRQSARALTGDVLGLDVTRMFGGRPQVFEFGAEIRWTYYNDSGSTIYPRLIYLGHRGPAFGPIPTPEPPAPRAAAKAAG